MQKSPLRNNRVLHINKGVGVHIKSQGTGFKSKNLLFPSKRKANNQGLFCCIECTIQLKHGCCMMSNVGLPKINFTEIQQFFHDILRYGCKTTSSLMFICDIYMEQIVQIIWYIQKCLQAPKTCKNALNCNFSDITNFKEYVQGVRGVSKF